MNLKKWLEGKLGPWAGSLPDEEYTYEWSGYIPIDGSPSPRLPVNINFSSTYCVVSDDPEQASYQEPVIYRHYNPGHVGYWIDRVHREGRIPAGEPAFYNWAAQDYVAPYVDGPVRGCIVLGDTVCIPGDIEDNEYAAAVEVDGELHAVVHGYVEGWRARREVEENGAPLIGDYIYLNKEKVRTW